MAQAVHAFDLNMRIVFCYEFGDMIVSGMLWRRSFVATLQRSSWGGENPISVIAVGESSTILSEGGSGDSHQSDHSVFGATHSDHRDDAASSGASGILMSVMMRREKRDSRHFKRMRFPRGSRFCCIHLVL
ncbi:hypothetical protein Bca101_085499 [Brassica carinata]